MRLAILLLAACGSSTTTAPVATPGAPAPCNGSITIFEATDMRDGPGEERTLFCQDDGTPAIKLVLSNVEDEGEPAVQAITVDVWTEIWALADQVSWKQAKKDCDFNEAPTIGSLRVERDGTLFEIDCTTDGMLPVVWSELIGAITAAGPTSAPEPEPIE